MTLGAPFTHEQHAGRQQPNGPPPVAGHVVSRLDGVFGSDPAIVGKTVRFAEFDGYRRRRRAARSRHAARRRLLDERALRLRTTSAHGQNAILRVKPGTTLERLRERAGRGRWRGSRATFRWPTPVANSSRSRWSASIVGDLGPTLLDRVRLDRAAAAAGLRERDEPAARARRRARARNRRPHGARREPRPHLGQL